MVGRILRSLQQRGAIGKASLKDPWQRPRPLRRPYGVRKPKEYVARGPGDIVQVDTAHIQPCPGWNFRHYTARDVVTRWDVLEAHSRATANTAAGFLDTILARMPFAVRAIQVDGGSEFMAHFEDASRERVVKLFVLPPRSPKLNGHVERAQRTHKEEFYEVRDLPDSLQEVNKMLRAWEEVYNSYRPHQALGNLTPKAFYHQSSQAAV